MKLIFRNPLRWAQGRRRIRQGGALVATEIGRYGNRVNATESTHLELCGKPDARLSKCPRDEALSSRNRNGQGKEPLTQLRG